MYQAVVGHLSVSCQAIKRQLSDSHQAVRKSWNYDFALILWRCFLSSPSACRMSGASKNWDWPPKNGPHFLLLWCNLAPWGFMRNMRTYTQSALHVQGVSEWTDISKSALRGRRINNFIEFMFHQPVFKKNDIGWPHQPPSEKVSDISKKFDFWWSILQKGTVIGHLDARDDQSIIIRRFFDEMRLSRSLRLLRPLRSLRLQRF